VHGDPLPKKVAARPTVRSMNWSGTTISLGWIRSFIDPTADAERILSTPNDFNA
jgi:hypothetical protein